MQIIMLHGISCLPVSNNSHYTTVTTQTCAHRHKALGCHTGMVTPPSELHNLCSTIHNIRKIRRIYMSADLMNKKLNQIFKGAKNTFDKFKLDELNLFIKFVKVFLHTVLVV